MLCTVASFSQGTFPGDGGRSAREAPAWEFIGDVENVWSASREFSDKRKEKYEQSWFTVFTLNKKKKTKNGEKNVVTYKKWRSRKKEKNNAKTMVYRRERKWHSVYGELLSRRVIRAANVGHHLGQCNFQKVSHIYALILYDRLKNNNFFFLYKKW